MERHRLGTTDHRVTEIGLGTWEIGGDWGDVSEETGRTAIRTALKGGVDFLDTADVYGDGRSERIIGETLSDHPAGEEVTVATKVGRRLDPHTADGYTHENLERFVERSRTNLGVESLDLVQLHCPPTSVYYRPETFAVLESLREDGLIDAYGVSVERVEEGLKAIEYGGVETVQVVFNPFRQRPAELFFREAARRNVGVIVRVPLASGLLTGTMSADASFPENDHRNFNREGDAFDVGETFAGVPLSVGVEAAERLRPAVPEDATLAQFALRWILSFDAVTTVIPGSTSPEHIRDNVAAADLPAPSGEDHALVDAVYESVIRDHVHHRW
ncbi:Predicted oxidoreductase [Halopenitus malekzadehii]|uniref:Predicted oxidoreductase n=1 Tax=Halopenitus malekzadehii TaxID=1267564 RepID=A0A1H6I3E3_9EURY|nr:aldo/keto reductase [Halopenitus malekzadehii]SEH42020.1 Predicted oxidoreductase [Halopenitus malekzadehii]